MPAFTGACSKRGLKINHAAAVGNLFGRRKTGRDMNNGTAIWLLDRQC